MASPSTRKRIVDDSYQNRYMNRIQLVLIETACFCVAYKLVTDSTNCFAPSVVMAKYSLGLYYKLNVTNYDVILICFVFLSNFRFEHGILLDVCSFNLPGSVSNFSVNMAFVLPDSVLEISNLYAN